MAKSKDYDKFYGKVLFDEDPDPDNKKIKFSRFGLKKKDKNRQPLDVVVLDKNQNILSEPGGNKKPPVHKNPADKNQKTEKTGRVNTDATDVQQDDGTVTYDFGDMGEEKGTVSRSGVHLTFAGSSGNLEELERGVTPVERYGSDDELADFSVDQQRSCRSVRSRRRTRIQDLLSESPASSSYNSSGSSAMSSLRGSGYSSRSSHEFPSAPFFYLETLERLYEYAGTIIEDRQALKDYLIARRAAILEHYYAHMEEIITYILKLKQAFLLEIEDTHKEHSRSVSKQTTKFHRIRHETQTVVQSIEDVCETPKPDAIRVTETMEMAKQRAAAFEEILRRLYDSIESFKYEFVPSEELKHAFMLSHVAHVDVTIDTPTLPPFLSTSSVSSKSDDGSSGNDRVDFESCTEGEQDKDTKRYAFSGITFITKDNLIVADWNNGFVKLYNKNGIIADKVEFEQSPWDVVQISEGRAAVTVPKLKTVYFLESDPHLHVTGSFSTKCECFGISMTGENYVITCDPWSSLPSVRVFSECGKLLKVFQLNPSGERIFQCPLHVCVDYFNTVIFVSDSSADCVHRIALKDNSISQCGHRLLEYPTGIAVDRNNLVYVCCKAHSNIHVLDGHGVHQRTDLRKKDGIISPRAICFHPYGDVMVVTDLDGSNCNGFFKKYLT